MSKELVPFELPLTFTVGPIHPDTDKPGFIRYATRLSGMEVEDIKKLIESIVNGETRGYVATMTIQEIFNDKEAFRNHVVDRIQNDLHQYGLEIHNANIEEMHDSEGNSYFSNLKMKALGKASTESRIAVAEARKEGNIGEKQKEVDTRKEKIVMEADAIKSESEQKQKMSDYSRNLEITQTENKRNENMAVIDAYNTTESKKIEVDSELHKKRQVQELERLRSVHVALAIANAEVVIKDANAVAESIKIKAEAHLFEKEKEALGIKAKLEAQAKGLQEIYNTSKQNPALASFYLALESGMFSPTGLFSVIANKQADAIKDMKPDIRIWNTDGKNDYTNAISGLVKSLPPLIDSIQQQTGVQIPMFNKKMNEVD